MKTEKKYKVLLCTESFKKKSEANKAIARIKKGIMDCLTEISIEELAEKVGAGGYPVALCEPEGKIGEALSKKHWRSQQIYMLDFDNSDKKKNKFEPPYYLTGKQAIRMSRKAGMTPAFGYHTLSNKKSYEKFRLVYVLDEPCTTEEEHEAVYAALSSVFVVNGTRLTDDKCSELSRVFYGGQKGDIFSASYGSTLSKKKLADRGRELIRRMALGKTGSDSTEHSLRAEGTSASDVNTDKISSGELKRRMAFCKRSSGTTETCLESSTDQLLQNMISDLKDLSKNSEMRREDLRSLVFTTVPGDEQGSTPNIIYKEILQGLLGVPQEQTPEPLDFTGDTDSFVKFCSQLKWNKCLELPDKGGFRCILPEHDDKNPSAQFSTYNGKVYYNCFASSCDKHLDVFDFLQYISNCSFTTACRYLALVFNLKFETKWQKRILDEIGWYEYFFDRERYVEKYKVLHKYFNRHRLRSVYIGMLRIMSDMARCGHIMTTDIDMFYIGGSLLYELLRKKGCNKGNKAIKRSLKDLERIGLIKAIPDDKIPEKQLDRLRMIQQKKKSKFRMTCYHIPIDNPEVLRHACEIIEQDKENGVRARARRSREGVKRAIGEEAAHEIFVQQTEEGFSEEVNEFYEHYKKAVKNLFAKKGWTTETEVINRMHFVDKESKKCEDKKNMLRAAKEKRKLYSVYCLPWLKRDGYVAILNFSKNVESKYSIDNKKAKLHYGASKVIVPGVKEISD